MNNKINWGLERLGEGRVRIVVDSFSKLPSIEDYKSYIKSLLKIGESEDIEKLRDESGSPDIGDSLLLYQELVDLKKTTEYKEVVFAGPEGDIVVNTENFEQVFNDLKIENKSENNNTNSTNNSNNDRSNAEAIESAVEELFERG